MWNEFLIFLWNPLPLCGIPSFGVDSLFLPPLPSSCLQGANPPDINACVNNASPSSPLPSPPHPSFRLQGANPPDIDACINNAGQSIRMITDAAMAMLEGGISAYWNWEGEEVGEERAGVGAWVGAVVWSGSQEEISPLASGGVSSPPP